MGNEEDIMGGSPEDVQGVCTAKPSCVEELSSLILKFDALGCSGWTPGDNPNEATDWNQQIDMIRKHSNDVSIVTEYFCENNCYAVTQAIVGGDESAAACECLLSFVAKVDKLTEDAKNALGLTSEVDSEVNRAIADKKCVSKNLRPSAIQL